MPSIQHHDASLFDTGFQDNQAPPVWCLSFSEGLLVAGCGNGRIEVSVCLIWERESQAPPIWCLSFSESLLVAGCGKGRIEVSICLI
jgi:hypothetical protein